jgi:hypothetical protein
MTFSDNAGLPLNAAGRNQAMGYFQYLPTKYFHHTDLSLRSRFKGITPTQDF